MSVVSILGGRGVAAAEPVPLTLTADKKDDKSKHVGHWRRKRIPCSVNLTVFLPVPVTMVHEEVFFWFCKKCSSFLEIGFKIFCCIFIRFLSSVFET